MDPISSVNHENGTVDGGTVNNHASKPDQLMSPAVETQCGDDEFWPLSGKTYFNVVLSKSHVGTARCSLCLPTRLHHLLPSAIVPTTVRCGGKKWEIMLNGKGRGKRFSGGWKDFVAGNELKIGDALVFELMDSNNVEDLKFRVQILKGDFPDELLPKVGGATRENAIIID